MNHLIRSRWGQRFVALMIAAAVPAACSPNADEQVDETNKQGEAVCMNSDKPSDGRYYATSFGCWTDESGVTHGDDADNCIPACYNKAKNNVCQGMGPQECEETVNWYAAGSTRFGCLTRLRVENPANGKAAVIVVLDAGPSCFVEDNAGGPVADLSYRVTQYLFGGPKGWKERAEVIVTEVSDDTPLGPTDGSGGQTTTGGGEPEPSTGSGGEPSTSSGGADAGCGSLPEEGDCQGSLNRWCEAGVLMSEDCAASGMVCDWVSSDGGYYSCI